LSLLCNEARETAAECKTSRGSQRPKGLVRNSIEKGGIP
jgi:hypothetical protein